MFRKRKTMLYFAPHQDDELLSMGIDICASLKKGYDTHVILCSDGSRSAVRKTLANGQKCQEHDGLHLYDLSIPEFIAARDREFLDSCRALGVPEKNIHIPEDRDVDGSLDVKHAEKRISDMVKAFNGQVIVCTLSPDNGTSQHRDHKALGRAAVNLMNRGVLQQVRLFVEPYHYGQIEKNPRLIPVAPVIIKAAPQVEQKLRQAIDSYSRWDPEQLRYAVGYHSVSSEFNDFMQELTCRFFTRYSPKSMTRAEELRYNHQRWKKLQHQEQLYYTISQCDPPVPGEWNMIRVNARDTEGYRAFCDRHSWLFRDKDLERIENGSSFWCLVSPEGTVMTSGWLAWKHPFYISEVDFGFDMAQSNTALLYDFNTKPEYRGQGLYGQLLRCIVCNAKEQPERFVIYTSPDNQSSDHGIRKAGFQFHGALTSADGSLEKMYRELGFTRLYRKYTAWGLRVRA